MQSLLFRNSSSIAITVAALAFCQPAFAQDTGVGGDVAESQSGDDVIIVTARKKEEILDNVPLQISVFDSEALERRDYRDLQDIGQATPGLEFENYLTSGLSTAPVIRGQSQTFATSRVQNTAVFFDGIYLQLQSMVNPGLTDVERVEVVKGPQSAVFGRNAFAGAINYVTKKPPEEFEAELSGTLGIHERYDYGIAVGVPIIPDVLSVRATYQKSEFDGHTRNMHPFANDGPGGNLGTDGRLGGWDDEVLSFALRITPTDSFEIEGGYYRFESVREPQPYYNLNGARQVTADTAWDAASNQGNCVNTMTTARLGPFVTIPIFGPHAFCGQFPTSPPSDPLLVAGGFPDQEILIDPRSLASRTESEIFRASVSMDFTENLNASFQYGRVEHSATGTGVASDRGSLIGDQGTVGAVPNPAFSPFGPPSGPPFFPTTGNFTTFNANPNETLESDSLEARLSWNGDGFDARIGAYYSKTKDSQYNVFRFIAPCDNAVTCAIPVDQAPPAIAPNIPPLGTGHALRSNETVFDDDVFAIFGDVSIDFGEEFTLIAEARYEKEDREFRQITTTFGAPDPFLAEESFDFFTPRVTLRWSPGGSGGDSIFYGLVAKGVKTGGFNAIDLNVNPGQLTFDEETAWTYEIGSRGRYFDDRLALNFAVYYIDWSGIQGDEAAESPNPFATDAIGNIGDARVWGLELDGVATISNAFNVDFALNWLDPKYTNGILEAAQTVNVDGSADPVSSYGCSDRTPECAANGDISGNTLQRTSTLSGSLGLNYAQPLEFLGDDWRVDARWDFNWRNKMYATPLNLAHNGDRLVSNANIGVSNDNFSINLWVKNIFNREYVANSFVVASFSRYLVGLGARRTAGITGKFTF